MLICKPDKHTIGKENHRPISLVNTDLKTSQPNTSKPIPVQMGFTPGMYDWFRVCKAIIMMHRINRVNDKNRMIISRDAEK